MFLSKLNSFLSSIKKDNLLDPLFCDKGNLTPFPIPFEFLLTEGTAGNLSANIFFVTEY